MDGTTGGEADWRRIDPVHDRVAVVDVPPVEQQAARDQRGKDGRQEHDRQIDQDDEIPLFADPRAGTTRLAAVFTRDGVRLDAPGGVLPFPHADHRGLIATATSAYSGGATMLG